MKDLRLFSGKCSSVAWTTQNVPIQQTHLQRNPSVIKILKILYSKFASVNAFLPSATSSSTAPFT